MDLPIIISLASLGISAAVAVASLIVFVRYDSRLKEQTKELNENEYAGKNNEKNFSDDVSGSDLDVPGSELDDEQENIGSEDEENNYYSLGGDDHNDLDEDKGE